MILTDDFASLGSPGTADCRIFIIWTFLDFSLLGCVCDFEELSGTALVFEYRSGKFFDSRAFASMFLSEFMSSCF